jgi:catechol 2,3-dioxygenase-like lactoylglutathione lyase family enzyme
VHRLVGNAIDGRTRILEEIEMDACLRYLAFLTNNPDELSGFYARHLGLREIGRSNQGDVSLTDGWFNITFLKARPELNEPDQTLGLHHVGLQVPNLQHVLDRYQDRNTRAMVVDEPGGVHFGDVRIYDPEARPISLTEGDFGINSTARCIPRIAHIAFNALDPTSILEFYDLLFGFRELDTSRLRREQGKKNRFAGDGFTNLAIHPFYNGAAEGHEPRFGVNHIGFLVSDMERKLENFAKEVPLAKRPETRPYAEYRLRDPEGNGFDLSLKKGWEVDVGKWENSLEEV